VEAKAAFDAAESEVVVAYDAGRVVAGRHHMYVIEGENSLDLILMTRSDCCLVGTNRCLTHLGVCLGLCNT